MGKRKGRTPDEKEWCPGAAANNARRQHSARSLLLRRRSEVAQSGCCKRLAAVAAAPLSACFCCCRHLLCACRGRRFAGRAARRHGPSSCGRAAVEAMTAPRRAQRLSSSEPTNKERGPASRSSGTRGWLAAGVVVVAPSSLKQIQGQCLACAFYSSQLRARERGASSGGERRKDACTRT